MSIKKISIVSLFLGMLILSGCVQVKPIPNYAKSGGSVLLGLGGIQRNFKSNFNLKTTDLSVKIIDSTGAEFIPKVESVFKLFPANDSVIQSNLKADQYRQYSKLINYDGAWFLLISLVNEDATDGELQPLAINPGLAKVIITSTDYEAHDVGLIEGDINDLPLEILAGQTVYDKDYVDQFAYYQAHPSGFFISYNGDIDTQSLGGVHVEFEVTNTDLFEYEPLATPLTNNPNITISTSYDKSVNPAVVKVGLISKMGFAEKNSALYNQASKEEINFYLPYKTKNGGTLSLIDDIKSAISINQEKSYYFDKNGSPLIGVKPKLQHFDDL